MKRIVAFLLLLATLLSLAACSEEKPTVIENVYANGRKWGNNLVAEQGDWLALRGEKDGVAGLALYNKSDKSAEFLLEGDVYYIALLDNKVYYKFLSEDTLYCYDIATGETLRLLTDVLEYQVRSDKIYYINAVHGNYIHTYDIASGATNELKTSYTVDAFWITDYGIYYCDDKRGMLMVQPFDTKTDRIVYKGEGKYIRDVVAIDGAFVGFYTVPAAGGLATLCSYNPATRKLTEHISADFNHINYARGHLVFVDQGTVYAVNPNDGKTFIWGELEKHNFPQLLSDGTVLYDGNRALLQPYPEDTKTEE